MMVIFVVAAGALLGLWYWWFVRYNRRKGAAALRWIQSACDGKGRVAFSRWRNHCVLEAALRLSSRWFNDAHVTVRLLPRPVPLRWLMSRWHKEKETVTFEANLGCPPQFQLEVRNHVWSGHNSRQLTAGKMRWDISRPAPVVLTTRRKWPQELNPVVSALVSSGEKNFLSLRFNSAPPHFAATFELRELENEAAAHGLLVALQELASGASARQI
jgi:hypothetical protein